MAYLWYGMIVWFFLPFGCRHFPQWGLRCPSAEWLRPLPTALPHTWSVAAESSRPHPSPSIWPAPTTTSASPSPAPGKHERYASFRILLKQNNFFLSQGLYFSQLWSNNWSQRIKNCSIYSNATLCFLDFTSNEPTLNFILKILKLLSFHSVLIFCGFLFFLYLPRNSARPPRHRRLRRPPDNCSCCSSVPHTRCTATPPGHHPLPLPLRTPPPSSEPPFWWKWSVESEGLAY